MNGKIITLACLAIAPLAFAQTNVTQPGAERSSKGSTAAAAPAAAGPIVSVNIFRPGKSIVVTSSIATQPVTYVLSENVQYVNSAGNRVDPRDIRAGTHVRLGISSSGTNRTVDRVVVVGQ